MKAGSRVSGHVKLVHRKRGDKFYIRYRPPSGKPVEKCLGPAWTGPGRPPVGYYNKTKAEDELRETLVDASRGTLPDPGRTGGHTFGEACDEWLRYIEFEKQRAPSTLRDYCNVVRRRLLPEFGRDTPLSSITTDAIDSYRERLLAEKELSRRSVQKVLVILHGILKRAKRRKWITENPAEDAEKVSVTRSGDFNVLSPEQVFAVARKTESDLMGAAIIVAAVTGLRTGELRALRWGDVDFLKRTIIVSRNLPCGGDEKGPKSGKVRSVPLIDQAARELDRLSRREHFTAPTDRVFTELGGPLNEDAMRDEFYAALTAAGLGRLREKPDPITFHDLRHTFGTLGAAVWPLHDLQGYMGHADIQTTMIYVHHVPKVVAADELTRAVDAATGSNGLPNHLPNKGISGTTESNPERLAAPETPQQYR
ncbi:MAG: tyrosine-type recombinase/integrase [Actinomycetota bacterium]